MEGQEAMDASAAMDTAVAAVAAVLESATAAGVVLNSAVANATTTTIATAATTTEVARQPSTAASPQSPAAGAGSRMGVSYDDVFSALQQPPSFPSNITKSRRRSINRSAAKSSLENGVLFRVKKNKKLQWVKDKETQLAILQSCHDHGTSGHYGRDKTRSKILEKFFWKGLYEDVEKFVHSCVICQKAERKMKQPTVLNAKHEVWTRLCVELIGPVPETSRGSTYVALCSDSWTKWPEAVALPGNTGKHIADFLFSLFCRHGCASILVTGQSQEFIAEVSCNLCQLCGVALELVSDQLETCPMLMQMMQETLACPDWESSLDPVLFSYRTTRHYTTGLTPFEMLYGKEARLPVSLNLLDAVSMAKVSMANAAARASSGLTNLDEYRDALQRRGNEMISISQLIRSKAVQTVAADTIQKSTNDDLGESMICADVVVATGLEYNG